MSSAICSVWTSLKFCHMVMSCRSIKLWGMVVCVFDIKNIDQKGKVST